MLKRVDFVLRTGIVFLSGLLPALPAFSWARAPQVVHGVFLDDALVLTYALGLALSGGALVLRTRAASVWVALGIVTLGTIGVMSAHVNPSRAGDLGEALRLYYLAGYFVIAAHWAISHGPLSVLRPYLLGAALGTLINIYYSVTVPYMVIASIPLLRMRNGAGGFIGFTLWLSAWLMLQRQNRWDRRLAVSSLVLTAIALVMSFSKTAVTMGACGLTAWVVVLWSQRRSRVFLRSAGAAAAVLLVVYASDPGLIHEYANATRRILWIKFQGLDLRDKYSLGARYMYFWGVSEVVRDHPAFGVSYSGFYDAIVQTGSYRTGLMANESRVAGVRGESNPHSSFLYYAAANGVPGILTTLSLFLGFQLLLWQALSRHGARGRAVWFCVVTTYLLYGATLPNMFNTKVIYLPAAMAVGCIAVPRSVRHAPMAAVPAAPRAPASMPVPAGS